MKICFASDYLPIYHKIWGGAEQAAYRFLELLAKRGHETAILLKKPEKKPKKDSTIFKYFAIPVLEDYSPQRTEYFVGQIKANLLPFDPFSYIFSYGALKKINPVVLHLHNFHSLSFSLVLVAKQLHIPVVFSIYDYWCICPLGTLVNHEGNACRKFHGSYCVKCIKHFKLKKMGKLEELFLSFFLMFRRKIFDFFLNKMDAFVVLSKSSSNILEEYGIMKEKIYEIPLFFPEDIDAQVRVQAPDEEDSILYVGWIHPRKGLHILLEAMPKILEDVGDAKLYVIGEHVDNGYMNKINDLIRKYELENRVFLLGKRNFQEVKKFFQRTKVIAIPEQWENMSPVILGEALYFGKAIVASKIGGIPEFINDCENGLLATPTDPDDFANKIVRVLKDKSFMRKMSDNAKKTGFDLFSEERNYQRLLNLYQSLMDLP